MAHPFAKMFDAALRKSRPDDMENRILLEAERLKGMGYRVSEIHDVLKKFAGGIVDDADSALAKEALEEFSRYIEE
jgi:hypothetical protein